MYKKMVVNHILQRVLLVGSVFLQCAHTGGKENTASTEISDYCTGSEVDTSVEMVVKNRVDKLLEEGKLTEITTPDSHPNLDAHFWLYEGKIVKVERRWRYLSKAEFELPPVGKVDKILLTIKNGWGGFDFENPVLNTIIIDLIKNSRQE